MRPLRRVLAAAVTALAIALVTGCTATTTSIARPTSGAPASDAPASGGAASGAPSDEAQSSAAPSAAPLGTPANPVRVAIVGDSLTAGVGRDLSQGLDADTWMTYAQGAGLRFVGGWAHSGARVEEMAVHVKPIADVDVLVLMAGTNDVNHDIALASVAKSYDSIVRTVSPKHVLIARIPPLATAPGRAAVYDAALVSYARAKHWDVVDPWYFARDGTAWVKGTTFDGTHPTVAGTRIVGVTIRAAVLELAQSRN